ncbi:nucleolar protein 12-domain-containing protein [Lipomyces orientalis]|uniref:Nucleolar protein 12-domain-containing protein n=1 Tax=Lipomyces orientalis TaxID=1233043 RepID=A0ACC3TVF1_9ASCO
MSFQRSSKNRPGGRVTKKTGGNGFRPKEILFDSDAREQYLKGFHKRNVERKEKAAERAKEHERQNKLEERRALREQRKRELDEKMQFASAMYKERLNDSESDVSHNESGFEEEEEWSGIVDDSTKQDSTDKPVASILKGGEKFRHIQKYNSDATNGDGPNDLIKSETTVIIENFDTEEPNQNGDSEIPPDGRSEEVLRKSLLRVGICCMLCRQEHTNWRYQAAFYAERVKKINSGRPVAPKRTKKKFRYLTPQERKSNAKKERARNKPRQQ